MPARDSRGRFVGGGKSLTIPLELDAKEAIKSVQQFGKEGEEAGNKASKAVDGVSSALSGMASSLASVYSLQNIASAAAASFERTATYIEQTTSNFVKLREAMVGLAGVQGQPLSNEFAQGQINIAKQSQFQTPAEIVQGMEAFSQYGSNYVDTANTGGNRINQKTVNDLIPEFLDYAKTSGVGPRDAMTIFAKMIQVLPKNSKKETYRDLYAKILETAKNSAGSATATVTALVPLLASQVNEFGAYAPTEQGILEAVKTASVQQEGHAMEAGTFTNALLRTLDTVHAQGKDSFFGITDKMSVNERVSQIGKKFSADGGGLSFKDFWRKNIGELDVRGGGALLTALSAYKSGAMGELSRKIGLASGAGISGTINKWRNQQQGDQWFIDRLKAIGEAETGVRWDDAQTEIARAEAQLSNEKVFDQPPGIVGLMTGMAGSLPYVGGFVESDPVKRLSNKRAIKNVYERLAGRSLTDDEVARQIAFRNNDYGGAQSVATAMGLNTYMANKEIRSVLEEIARNTAAAVKPKPIAAPPAAPKTRPGP